MHKESDQVDLPSPPPIGVGETNFAHFEQAFSSGKQAPRISGYDILSMLGAGGMGTVWRTRQHGTGRDVAIKLLTDRPTDARAPARFIREVELASRLEHPNIARVYESGVHDGEFYYAMELVEGVPLDLWVRQRKLGEAAILELLRIVCDAVQHAHYKGIIHRDLKPSNVLVSHDGQPRLLDFGLARPITPGAAAIVSDDRSSVAGTPAYMSPEQAASRADQIDTRSDVYSLGKILYELVLGRPAHDLGGSQYDLWRRVVEEDIRRPREVRATLSADLEAVLLKALDRDARNRYASAGDLGADLKNILAGEPVSARPATLSYFVGKKLARHKSVVLASVAVAIVLAGAGIFGVARITHERNVANAERIKAQREAANATAMNRFFQLVLDSLDPKNARGINNVGREMMERADRSLSESFAGDSHTEASIRIALGKNMLALGQFATAESQLGRARELLTKASANHDPQFDEPQLLSAEDLLAQVQRERGNISAAADLNRHVFERYKTLFGDKDSRTLAAMNTLSYVLNDLGRRDEAEAAARLALKLSGEIIGPEDLTAGRSIPLTLNIASTLTRHLSDSNDPVKINEAQAWARQICAGWSRIAANGNPASTGTGAPFEIPSDPQSLEAYADLASVLNRQNESDPKISLNWHAIARSPTVFGLDHPLLFAASKAAYGFVESEIDYQRRWDEAISLHRSVVEKGTAVLGPDHPDLLIWKNNMAVALEGRKEPKDLREAEQIYRSLLPAAMEIRGSQHRYTVIALNGLAIALRLQGRSAADYDQQIETYSTRALDRLLPEFGPQNAQALWFLDAQAQSLKYQGKLGASESAYIKALNGRQTLFGPAHRDTLTTAWNLGIVYKEEHQWDKATLILSQTLKTCERVLPPDDPLTRNVRRTLGDTQWIWWF